MYPKIKFYGFEISAEMEKYLSRQLLDLLELCPYDSQMNATVAKSGDRYDIAVFVYFMGGGFSARMSSVELRSSIRGVLDRLYDQVRAWRESRFTGIDWQWEMDDIGLEIDTSEPATARPTPRVLIVDDERTSTYLLESCLKEIGCDVQVVGSGAEAVQEITSNPYDLLFLDWMMPDMNGGEALRMAETLNSENILSDYQWTALRLPVITYSAHSRKEIDLPECKHFRFLGHWTKSMPLPELVHQAKFALSQIHSDIGNSRL